MNVFTPTIATDLEAQKRVRKWIRALRSGKYKQAEGVLRNNHNAFCCLGVACDISAPGDWIMDGGYVDGHPLGDEGAINSKLGTKALRSLRLSTKGQSKLIRLNDDGHSFKAIAARLSADMKARLAA